MLSDTTIRRPAFARNRILRIGAEAAEPEHERLAGRHAAGQIVVVGEQRAVRWHQPGQRRDQIVRLLDARKGLLQVPLQVGEHLRLVQIGVRPCPSTWQFGG